jgi:hypothetical protein
VRCLFFVNVDVYDQAGGKRRVHAIFFRQRRRGCVDKYVSRALLLISTCKQYHMVDLIAYERIIPSRATSFKDTCCCADNHRAGYEIHS